MQYKGNPKILPAARALRKNMTRQEKKLWYGFLSKYPVRFYRQKVLGRYIADFYCAKASLVVELDGSQHYTYRGCERDALRTRFLEGYGLYVLRIPNCEIDSNYEGVCLYVDRIVKERCAKGGSVIAPPGVSRQARRQTSISSGNNKEGS